MKITSPAFGHKERIPVKFTCDGADINPPLDIEGVPNEAKSLALIVEDPDAAAGTWAHWLIWNMPPTLLKIMENTVPLGSVEGTTSFDKPGYGGPCPPSGTHNYFFKLYALDSMLNLPPTATREELKEAIEPHLIDKAKLIGLYSRE